MPKKIELLDVKGSPFPAGFRLALDEHESLVLQPGESLEVEDEIVDHLLHDYGPKVFRVKSETPPKVPPKE